MTNIPPERTIEAMVDDIEGVYEKVLKSQRSATPNSETEPVGGIITTL
jgi:hypothetical protein